MNTNFKVIRFTRLGIKPESTATEADALTTQASELHRLQLSARPSEDLSIFRMGPR